MGAAATDRLSKVGSALRGHPRAVTFSAFSAFAVVAAVGAYWAVFTFFAPWDDEGTLLVTLKSFVDGHTLYRDVFSQYGPFYYEVFGGLFALTGRSITNDASRSIVAVIWVTASVMLGVTAMRLTGRLSLGLVAAAVAFNELYALVNEPMHPVGLCVLLLSALALVLVTVPEHRGLLLGILTGALLGALVLTKVNLGLFAVAAVAAAAVCTCSGLHRRAGLRRLVLGFFIALPLLLTYSHARHDYIRDLIVWATLGFAAVVVAARSLRPPSGEDDGALSRWVLGTIVGFVALVIATLAVLLVTGASLGDAYNGIIGRALEQADVFSIPFALPSSSVLCAVAGLSGALLTVRLGPGSAMVAGVLRIGAGVSIWLAAAKFGPVWASASGPPLMIPMALAWVAAVPPSGITLTPRGRLIRVLFPALAVAEVLQVYPVAGTQVAAATIMFGPVGALCIADGWHALRAGLLERGVAADRSSYVARVLLGALVVLALWSLVLRPVIASGISYGDRKPLPFPEASRLRLSVAERDTYTGLVKALRDNGCTTLISYPGLDSLYLWAHIDDPIPTLPGSWYVQLDDATQRRVVKQLRASPRPCAFRNDQQAQFWLQGRPVPNGPALRYLFNEFTPAAQVGPWQLLVPKS